MHSFDVSTEKGSSFKEEADRHMKYISLFCDFKSADRQILFTFKFFSKFQICFNNKDLSADDLPYKACSNKCT